MKTKSLVYYSLISSIFLFSLVSIWKILVTLQGIELKNFNFAIIITFFICMFLKQSLSLSFRDIAISFSMGIFQVGGGLVLYTIGSKALSAADLTLLSLAEVVLGPVWVWLFLGELASNNTLIGGSILLLAIITNAVSGKRWKPPPIM